ncbi:MAG TPA: hypothetical protein DDZ51_02575 [Planctomycetaceae bacterium]|nr:hypothetical protein [Planctomycetaceae bacterium]
MHHIVINKNWRSIKSKKWGWRSSLLSRFKIVSVVTRIKIDAIDADGVKPVTRSHPPIQLSRRAKMQPQPDAWQLDRIGMIVGVGSPRVDLSGNGWGRQFWSLNGWQDKRFQWAR